MAERTPLVGGNWKMNLDCTGATALARAVAAGLPPAERVAVLLFPAFPHLGVVAQALSGSVARLGAQDCYHQPDGAFTGEVSLNMLRDAGVAAVLVGHSERRHVIGESDLLVNAKLRAGLEAGMQVVLCVGETLEQRERGQTDAINAAQVRYGLAGVTSAQMDRVAVAYEPVWAIGTGRTATPDDAQAAHAAIRAVLGSAFGSDVAAATRIQYGGSVKPDNAASLFAQPDIDGGLIGGAALEGTAFLAIAAAAAEA